MADRLTLKERLRVHNAIGMDMVLSAQAVHSLYFIVSAAEEQVRNADQMAEVANAVLDKAQADVKQQRRIVVANLVLFAVNMTLAVIL